MTRRQTNHRLCRQALGVKKALRGWVRGRPGTAHPQRMPSTMEHRSSVYQLPLFIEQEGGLRSAPAGTVLLGAPGGRSKPGRTPPLSEGVALVDLWPGEVCPLPGNWALAGPQRGPKKAISFLKLGIRCHPTHGASGPSEPRPTPQWSSTPQRRRRSKVTWSPGMLPSCRDTLIRGC